MSNTYFIIVSLFLGLILSYRFNYSKKNDKSVQEILLVVNKTCYHIHHYIWLSIVIVCILIGRYIRSDRIIFCIIAFALGSCLEDFFYTDWYLIKGNCHKNRLFNIKSNN